MIHAVVIDDDAVFLEQFGRVLRRIMREENVEFSLEAVTEPGDLLETDRNYDIYFFDVVMPGISGIQLADKLRQRGNNKKFVFVSRHERYARASMVAEPCGYIRKLYLEEDLREVLSNLNPLLTIKGREVILKSNKKDYVIQLPQIMLINSEGHYLRLMYEDGRSTLIRNSMKAIEAELRKFDFLRVSNRCMVNMHYLKSVRKNEVFLKNGHSERMTRKYFKEASIVLGNWLEACKVN